MYLFNDYFPNIFTLLFYFIYDYFFPPMFRNTFFDFFFAVLGQEFFLQENIFSIRKNAEDFSENKGFRPWQQINDEPKTLIKISDHYREINIFLTSSIVYSKTSRTF